MLIVALTILIHCATLLRVTTFFSVSVNSLELCMPISDILDNLIEFGDKFDN